MTSHSGERPTITVGTNIHARAESRDRWPLKRRAVVIVGMHRSGTSALARVLATCGLGLPRTLVPADDGNRAGHWESKPVCAFNDRLLARIGLDWISPNGAAADFSSEPDYADILREGRRIIIEEYGATGDIILKDPRISRTLPIWLDILAQLEIEPTVVLALREPRQVALSLWRRNAILPSYGLRAWLRFTLEAERASRRVPRIVVGFDEVMDDWLATARKLDRRAGAGLLDFRAEADSEVSAFLSADLRHFTHGNAARPMPEGIARTYAILRRWQTAHETGEDYIELDSIRSALNGAPPLLMRYEIAGWAAHWLNRQQERLALWLSRRSADERAPLPLGIPG